VQLDSTLDQAQLTVAMTRLDAILGQLFPAEQHPAEPEGVAA
jgi:hypothetical protein